MPFYAIDDISPIVPASGRYWVAPDANIIGRIRLEEDASIWFGCTLRGDREWINIGARTNVQEHSIIHTDPGLEVFIGSDVTVGHGVILHGCTVGDNSLIGMGATVLNGARIGRNCLVGANALVTEGKEFPDYSLIVGAPAKAVRTLTEEDAARIAKSAGHYVRNAQAYAKALRQVEPEKK